MRSPGEARARRHARSAAGHLDHAARGSPRSVRSPRGARSTSATNDEVFGRPLPIDERAARPGHVERATGTERVDHETRFAGGLRQHAALGRAERTGRDQPESLAATSGVLGVDVDPVEEDEVGVARDAGTHRRGRRSRSTPRACRRGSRGRARSPDRRARGRPAARALRCASPAARSRRACRPPRRTDRGAGRLVRDRLVIRQRSPRRTVPARDRRARSSDDDVEQHVMLGEDPEPPAVLAPRPVRSR